MTANDASAPGNYGPAGIDLAELDAAVRPQDDLFRYMNGKWIARTEIPADKARYGSFAVLAENAREAAVRDIITGMSAPEAGLIEGAGEPREGEASEGSTGAATAAAHHQRGQQNCGAICEFYRQGSRELARCSSNCGGY